MGRPIALHVWDGALASAVERGVVLLPDAWGDGVKVVEARGERWEPRGSAGGIGFGAFGIRGGGGVRVGVGVGIVDERHEGRHCEVY